MKLIFFALIVWLWSDICYGAVFDPYTRRYNIRNASFESLFSPSSTPTTTSLQSLINAAPVIDNTRCKSAYQFASTSSINQLANFQYELVDLCPKVYETIKYKNITTWGPVEEFLQIWYMRFLDSVWKKIQTRTGTCRCQLYDDFIAGAQATTSDTVLQQYLLANYDPALCLINADTMYKWHLFLQKTQIKNRINKFLRIGDFSVQLVQAIAKTYLTEARYNSYFEISPAINEYPLLAYFNASLSSTAYTVSQKSFISQIRNYFKQQFPTRDLAERQQLFLMKFSESIDLTYANFQTLNSIPLHPADGLTHYDLLLYLSRKDFLIAKRLEYTSGTVTPCVVTTTTTTTKKPTTTTTTTIKPTTTTTTAKPTTTTTTLKPTTTTSTTTTTTPTTTSTTTTASTTTTPTPVCGDPIDGQATIYIENGVVLDDDDAFPKVGPIRTCTASTGVITYYDGNTPAVWLNSAGERVFAGEWIRDTCTTPCACTATACYTPVPGNPSSDPLIHLYPHCITPDNCFVTLTFESPGSIVNPLNPANQYTFIEQDATGGDVTDPAFPRITRVGCSSCPFTTTPTIPPPTCTTTPSNAAAIYIEDGVVLNDDTDFPKADPVGTCINSSKGVINYLNGTTSTVWVSSSGKAFVGKWIRATCAVPCVCTATACYTPSPGNPSVNPNIFLYPHCITPDNCFVALTFSTVGSIVNPSNPGEQYTLVAQDASTGDVTGPEYPRITKIGCSSCPLTL